MKVQLIAVAASAMCASGLLAGEYQTVKISNVDEELAKYTAATNGMAKHKIRFVKHNTVRPDGETAALKAPDDRRNPRLQFPVEIRRAGEYSFWVRHWRAENMRTALEFLLRAPNGECVNYTLVDRFEDMWVDKDAEGRKFRSGEPAGWIWSKVTVGVEFPGRYVVNIGRNTRYVQKGMDIGSCPLAVAECWATNDPDADPSKAPLVESDTETVNAVRRGLSQRPATPRTSCSTRPSKTRRSVRRTSSWSATAGSWIQCATSSTGRRTDSGAARTKPRTGTR